MQPGDERGAPDQEEQSDHGRPDGEEHTGEAGHGGDGPDRALAEHGDVVRRVLRRLLRESQPVVERGTLEVPQPAELVDAGEEPVLDGDDEALPDHLVEVSGQLRQYGGDRADPGDGERESGGPACVGVAAVADLVEEELPEPGGERGQQPGDRGRPEHRGGAHPGGLELERQAGEGGTEPQPGARGRAGRRPGQP